MKEYKSENISNNSITMPQIENENFEFSNQDLLSPTNIDNIPSSGSMDSFFEELFRTSCSHTHTCNPPGPDLTHTHTCFHVHTKIVPPTSEEKSGNNDDSADSTENKSTKRGRERGGNREAVRKYRQKKKAHTASLEDEVVSLRAINQKLLMRLQSQTVLENEVVRLKSLLVDIRGRIEGEIGSFPYQRPVNNQNIANTSFPGSYMIPCNAHGDQMYCLHEGKAPEGLPVNVQGGLNGCDFENVNCMASLGSAPSLSCATTNVTSTTIGSSGNVNARRKR